VQQETEVSTAIRHVCQPGSHRGDTALHYKELVAAIINLNKIKSWGLQKRWWLCRQRRMKTVGALSTIEVVNEN
jgi:hypothetical protein